MCNERHNKGKLIENVLLQKLINIGIYRQDVQKKWSLITTLQIDYHFAHLNSFNVPAMQLTKLLICQPKKMTKKQSVSLNVRKKTKNNIRRKRKHHLEHIH